MDKHLIEAFKQGNVQLFVGSGLSYGIYDNADRLCKRILKEKIYTGGKERSLKEILSGQSEPSLQDAAEYYEEYNGSYELMALIKRIYSRKRNCTQSHIDLWKMPGVRMIYTTNYDGLIEEGLRSPTREPIIATRLSELKSVDPDYKVVFKPHGCAHTSSERTDFVITRSDYLHYGHRRILEELKTLYDIFTRTFLFIGYSLSDINMQQIITEANRLEPNIRAYAVIKNFAKPEARYWERLNVKLIKRKAADFITETLRIFPPDISEWAGKVEKRVSEKEKIANLAVEIIKEHYAKDKKGLNIIMDSGSTCLCLARALLHELEETRIQRVLREIHKEQKGKGKKNKKGKKARRPRSGKIDLKKSIAIITNSAPIDAEISAYAHAIRQGLELFTTHGALKPDTQAFIFKDDGGVAKFLNTKPRKGKKKRKERKRKKRKTLAFIGATAITEKALQTKTKDEIVAKKCFIDNAEKVLSLIHI